MGVRAAGARRLRIAMIRLNLEIALYYDVGAQGADFVFNIHAAQTPRQTVLSETLTIGPMVKSHLHTEPSTSTRFLRLHAERGPLAVRYQAVVQLDHHRARPATLAEVPVHELPPDVVPYLLPSRYCQSDCLLRHAAREFGALPPGYARVQAICDWVHAHVKFVPNTSNASTSAVDTLIERVGVCRDFAHLMIALCRAVNIPARMATGTDYGADPAMGPPDFHAYVEAFVGGRWYIFDPSGVSIPLGLVRLGTGRDATDVAFATIFGAVASAAPFIAVHAVQDAANGIAQPEPTRDAISTWGPHERLAPARAARDDTSEMLYV